jgi:hypothetical protein
MENTSPPRLGLAGSLSPPLIQKLITLLHKKERVSQKKKKEEKKREEKKKGPVPQSHITQLLGVILFLVIAKVLTHQGEITQFKTCGGGRG